MNGAGLRLQLCAAATNTDTMNSRGRKINDLQKWRRGWDSNSLALVNPRKLLILRGATNARTPLIAQVGYSFGTHSLARLIFPQVANPKTVPVCSAPDRSRFMRCVYEPAKANRERDLAGMTKMLNRIDQAKQEVEGGKLSDAESRAASRPSTRPAQTCAFMRTKMLFERRGKSRSGGESVVLAQTSAIFQPATHRRPTMKLTSQQSYELLEKHGSYITEICDRCGKGIGPVRFTRKDDPGVWCSRECRDGKESRATGEKCRGCGAVLEGKRKGAKWCGDNCRKGIPSVAQDKTNNPESAPHSKGVTRTKMPLGCRFSRQPAFVGLSVSGLEPT